MADYLLAEVLERQSAEVRQLLLRTSLLERVSGPLADRLTGSSGSERILMELEDAGAFVVAVDSGADLVSLPPPVCGPARARAARIAPQEVPGLHTIAAVWWAEHGHPVEAIRHAQAAENWGLAARLLADNWFGLYFDGRLATRRELLSGFPAGVVAADPELVVLAGADKRAAGSLEEAERCLGLAVRMSASVLEDRRARFTIALAFERFKLGPGPQRPSGRCRGGTATARPYPAATELGVGEEVRTRVLTDLGIAEMWAGRLEDSERHLEDGLEEARRISIPMLELHALAHRALLSVFRSLEPVEQRAIQAIELARKHGWEETAPAAAAAYVALGGTTVWRGRLGRGRVVARPGRTRPRARHPTHPRRSCTRHGHWRSRAAGTRRRRQPIGKPSGWTGCSSCRTSSRRACKRSSSECSSAWAKPNRWNAPSPTWTKRIAKRARCGPYSRL